MTDEVQQALHEVVRLWEAMKVSDSAEAGADADRFQMKFYDFVEAVRGYAKSMADLPKDAFAAHDDPRFKSLYEGLPEPLKIPFESELDAILEDREMDVDSTEQS